jgi:N-acetyl sugar amidotransferase
MRYCKCCIMPNTRPEQVFDEDGVCDACVSAAKKREIDWEQRRAEFESILVKYRGDGSKYDCIIPASGGKDSCFQALTMRDRFNMNPLLVNHVPCELTDTGWKNLIFMRELGFDTIHVAANIKNYREMVRIGFFKLGDCCWPEHIGIFTAPVRVAVQYKIPLLVWGENSQFEYGGPASKKDNNYLDKNWLEQFQMLGYRISDLKNDGINLNDVKTFHYPDDTEIREVGVSGLFLGHYVKWDSIENANMVSKLGWSKNPGGPVEGAYNDVENLDCKWVGGLHDYMKFLKYGYGRATDQLCIEIRAGRMARGQALAEYEKTSEGKIPWKYIPDFLRYLGITEVEFFNNLDKFTNKKLFETIDRKVVKDSDGNVIRKYKPV